MAADQRILWNQENHLEKLWRFFVRVILAGGGQEKEEGGERKGGRDAEGEGRRVREGLTDCRIWLASKQKEMLSCFEIDNHSHGFKLGEKKKKRKKRG